jgi:ADP-ribose pyrophosphatase
MRKNKLYQSKNFSVSSYNMQVDGKKIKQEIIEQKNAAAILAFENDQIILVKQFRYPLGYVLEIPAGVVQNHETPKQCVVRELEEETGYKAKNVKHLMKIYPMLGYNLQSIDCFVSTDIKNSGKQKLDDEEFLTVTKTSFKKLLSMIKNREIVEPRTICAALTYALKKNIIN